MITETIINEVARKVEAVTGFSLEEIRSKSRYCPLVRARVILAYELRRWNLTYIEIANAINRNHSTLTHYLNTMPIPYFVRWQIVLKVDKPYRENSNKCG